ncbi:conserved hypothetical protein [Talaromyces stipitatus ATCC 10500]|uniref:Rhodopsin domain-containing protein n=1 Tax=Talaromyces stipitatus (strain ATCC 10500 / CBS 375.48 / QM 6759 / NRRL 1006) TaxID=441959 RepID=B8MFT2_TALSN|nr:uncharacterized protein TSTA_009230 [Talaromyces stipitatus ATCC 10500]EED15800.1 conserved hypothetical protein [Talaromyces stipitatus ATCC 10500]
MMAANSVDLNANSKGGLIAPFYAGEAALVFWWIRLGLGRHESTVPLEDLAQASKIVFASGYLFNTGLALPKFSVILFYHRIFGKTTKWFYVLMWVAGALNMAWLITTYFCATFQCSPVRAAWTTVPGSTCIPIGRIYIGTSIVSTIVDLIIITMPMPLLLGLHASKSRRTLVLIIFICGYCVIVTSLGRLITVAKVGAGLTQDITWSDVTYIKWVQCEGALSITSASLPNILGFARQIYWHGFRVSIARKVRYSRQGSGTGHSKTRQNFHEMNAIAPENGIIRTTEWNTTTTQTVPSTRSTPADQFGSEEELGILTGSQPTRFYFIGRGDEHTKAYHR